LTAPAAEKANPTCIKAFPEICCRCCSSVPARRADARNASVFPHGPLSAYPDSPAVHGRLGLHNVSPPRFMEHIPLINQFGDLLLVVAKQ